MVLVLTACTSAGLPSPSVSSQPTSSHKPIQAEDYAGLLELVAKAAQNQPPYARRYMAGADTDAMRNAEGTRSQAGDIKDYSQTNIQVEGVDEADIIKTDGRYLYLIANSRLYVIDAGTRHSSKSFSNTRSTLTPRKIKRSSRRHRPSCSDIDISVSS
jgi:uncharacterized secreted protein with C-terminal beta-propeller domain